MNLTRPTASALGGLMVAAMVLTVPARAQDGDDLGTLVSKSLEAMNAQKWPEALAMLDSAVKRFGGNAKLYGPQFGVIYYRKGICEMKLKMWAEAMKSFEICYREFPNAGSDVKAGGGNVYHKKALLKWGEAALGAEDWALAIRQFKKYLEEKEKSESYPLGTFQINMAICHYRLLKIPEGNGFLETAIKNKYDPVYNVPEAGIVAAFQALVVAVIEKNNEQALLDFVAKNRADITLEPFEMTDFTKLYMKLAADAIAVDMERAAMRLYQLVPTTEAAIQDTKLRVEALSFRPGIKDGGRMISTKVLTENLARLGADRSANKIPEITTLAAAAFLHEQDGNTRGAYAAYEQLELYFPKAAKREDNLYNLVRTSSIIGEVFQTEVYGQSFLKVFPNSKYVPQVRRMLLSSLFYEGEYATCIEVASVMISTLAKPSKEHDICLHVLGGSYYYTGVFDKAQPLLSEHVKLYPESQFTEAARYFEASNYSRLQEWDKSASLLDAFFAKYPDPKSNIFYPFALYDRANCHYAKDEYQPALDKLNRLDADFPNAEVMEMALNLRGNVQQSLKLPEDAEKSYLAAVKLAKTRGNDAVVGEALYYLVAMLGEQKKGDKEPNPRLKDAVPFADEFWKTYAEESIYKAQMAVAQMAALDFVGRGDEALGMLQTVITEMATSENTTGLEAAINSYTDAYLAKDKNDKPKHTPEELKTHYLEFPGIRATDKEARAILRMAVIGVYEGVLKEAKTDDEKSKAQAMIKVLFRDLKSEFNPKDLTNFILVRVGDFIRKSANPAEALPFYDQAIGSEDQSNRFAALLGRADVYTRTGGAGQLDKAITDFERVFKDSQDKSEKEQALFGLVTAMMVKKEYPEAAEKAKEYLNGAHNKRNAEVSMMLAQSYDERGEVNDAIAAYAKVWGAYTGYVRISAPAMKRWMELSWTRDLAARTNDQGDAAVGDHQGAYNGGAGYIEGTSRPDFQAKMTEEDIILWKQVEALVKKYESDPAIKSLAQQKKENEANRRRR
ncbi:MAG: tetratricopeptide repeat protein [Akkermansiaceae bacterium]|nr:tetratricopeptide repeat protein [Akkermansiaceae bacterium]